MNGETFTIDPDFSVLFGCRATLSLIGLATGVVGYLVMERQWDNQAPTAITTTLGSPEEVPDNETGNNAASSSYVNMNNNDPDKVVGQAFHYNGARDLVRVRTGDSTDKEYHPEQAAGTFTEAIQSAVAASYYGTSEAVEAKLGKAFPTPKMMLVGLSLWSLSFLLDPAIGGLRFYANFFNVSCCVLSALLGPLVAFPMRKAILERDYGYKKKLVVVFAVISVLISSFSIADPEVDAPWYFTIVAGEYNLNRREEHEYGRRIWSFCTFWNYFALSCPYIRLTLPEPTTTSFLLSMYQTNNQSNRLVHIRLSRCVHDITKDGIFMVF